LERAAGGGEAEEGEAVVVGPSLISGEEEPLARLHPQLKGVAGANTMGAAIVSFNLNAFESYGKSQSYNAPVGTRDAFRYTTALNRLLADGARRTRHGDALKMKDIGDATVVFWSDRPEGDAAGEQLRQLLGADFPREEPAEDAKTTSRVGRFLEDLRQGHLWDRLKDPDAPFYILGLSPNASRLNVRYWLAGTVRQFVERLARHLEQLEIVGARPTDPPMSIRAMVAETAREPKDVAPQLAGEVARAVLGGLPYPQLLFNAVVRRIRAEPAVNHRRASILKAYLIRNQQLEVPVALDKDHSDEAYQIGRLFAALEKTQEDATDRKINTTIKDRFFSSAGSTPGSVFPRLLQLHHHHLRNFEREGLRISREKLVGEIVGRIGRFPSHLSLERQGLFYIGYYHQRQDFFTKRSDNNQEATNE
jgi:CRISPR-associated protein Csd1